MIVFAVVGIGGGSAILKWTSQVYRFFKKGMDAMTIYPDNVRNTTMTPRNLRIGAVGTISFGALAAIILVWRVLHGLS